MIEIKPKKQGWTMMRGGERYFWHPSSGWRKRFGVGRRSIWMTALILEAEVPEDVWTAYCAWRLTQ